MERILWIDDDTLLLQSVTPQLEAEGFHVVTESTATDGLARCANENFSVILLDVGLPDGDGCDVCQTLRKQGLNTPIVLLTGADSDEDTICGLESGASDYIAKPFRLAILVARLHAQIRQHEQHNDVVLKVGPYTFRPADKLLLDSRGKRIRLSDREVDILKCLYRAGRTVSREELLHRVWGYTTEVNTHTIESHVYRLRQKIEPNRDHVSILLTESGGYRLVDSDSNS